MREWVTLVVALTLVYYHNAPALHAAIGSVICCAVAKILKLAIKQNRPIHATRTSYGMPSTHSAAVAYFAAYLVHILDDLGHSGSLRLHRAHAFSALVIVLSSVGALSRVFNGHHTLPQVLAGSLLGVSFAAVWWSIRLSSYVYIDPLLAMLSLQ
ncbi:hypothetical protein GGI05_003243 [Coemansia sp. RSA 2603]|nr:hypothetical protein GGI05_003243 [Coemansia sp. RSA 2603]